MPRLPASCSIAVCTLTEVGNTLSVSISSTRKSLERVLPRRRQRELVADAGFQRIRSRDHVEQQRKIGGAARHRADHREVAFERQRRKWRRRVAARRRQAEGRLVRIDAAMKRRHAQRAADVGAERERTVARRQRRRRSAGGAAGRAAEVVGIVGGAVDVVVALPVGERDRHVGLAEDDAARVLHPRDRQRVFRRPEILLRRKAPGGRQPRDVVGFLHRHRQAEQRPCLAARQRRIGGARGIQAAVEIANADRVDFRIVALDAARWRPAPVPPRRLFSPQALPNIRRRS